MSKNKPQMKYFGTMRLLKNIQFIINVAETNFITINSDGQKCDFVDYLQLNFSYSFSFTQPNSKGHYYQFKVILVTAWGFFFAGGWREANRKIQKFLQVTPLSLLYLFFPRGCYLRNFQEHLTSKKTSLPSSLSRVHTGFK